jgi:hypothetical protein
MVACLEGIPGCDDIAREQAASAFDKDSGKLPGFGMESVPLEKIGGTHESGHVNAAKVECLIKQGANAIADALLLIVRRRPGSVGTGSRDKVGKPEVGILRPEAAGERDGFRGTAFQSDQQLP